MAATLISDNIVLKEENNYLGKRGYYLLWFLKVVMGLSAKGKTVRSGKHFRLIT